MSSGSQRNSRPGHASFGATYPAMSGAAAARFPAVASIGRNRPAGGALVDGVIRSAGHPLPADTRSDMESRYRHDFSTVRIHADQHAAEAARSLAARAFTVGDHIAFASGKYAPGNPAGRRLIAHELAHVVQQSRGATRPPSGDAQGPDERDARQAAEAASQPTSAPVRVAEATARDVACDPDEDERKRQWQTQSMLPKSLSAQLGTLGITPVAAPPVIWMGAPPADAKFKSQVEATAKDWLAGGKMKTGVLPDAAAPPTIVMNIPGFSDAFKEHSPTDKPTQKPALPKIGNRAPIQDAREKFGDVREGFANQLSVGPGGQVHHAIELQVLGRYGVFTESELNSSANMRGIRPELGGKRQLHNAGIRAFWDRHYRALDDEIAKRGLKKGTPEYATYVRNYLEAARDESDYLHKPMYSESVAGQLAADAAAKAAQAKALADQTRQVVNQQAMQQGLPPLLKNPAQEATPFEATPDFARKWVPIYDRQTGDILGYNDKVRRFDESPLHTVDRQGRFLGYGDATPRFDTVPMIDPIDLIPFEMVGSMIAKGTLIGGRIVLKGIFRAGVRGVEKEVVEKGIRIGVSTAEKAGAAAVADVVKAEVEQAAPRLFRIVDGELVEITGQQAKVPLMRIINGELVEITEEEAVRELMRDLAAEAEEEAVDQAAKEVRRRLSHP